MIGAIRSAIFPSPRRYLSQDNAVLFDLFDTWIANGCQNNIAQEILNRLEISGRLIKQGGSSKRYQFHQAQPGINPDSDRLLRYIFDKLVGCEWDSENPKRDYFLRLAEAQEPFGTPPYYPKMTKLFYVTIPKAVIKAIKDLSEFRVTELTGLITIAAGACSGLACIGLFNASLDLVSSMPVVEVIWTAINNWVGIFVAGQPILPFLLSVACLVVLLNELLAGFDLSMGTSFSLFPSVFYSNVSSLLKLLDNPNIIPTKDSIRSAFNEVRREVVKRVCEFFKETWTDCLQQEDRKAFACWKRVLISPHVQVPN